MSESLGKILKKIRESKHLSIEEISERSRIPRHIVSILEEDRLDEIKSVFYAKSFVKTYAVFLGALGEAAVKEFLAREGSNPVITRREAPKQSQKGDCFASSRPLFTKGGASLAMTLAGKYKRQIIAIIIGIFAFWTLSFAVGQAAKSIKGMSAKKQPKAVKNAPQRHKTAGQAVKEKKEGQKAKDVKKEASDERLDSVKLEVSASDNTWLKIICDGDLVFTGSFKKGSKEGWSAKKEIKLEAGDSGVIKITVNGKPASFSGKKGGEKEAVITKDGIR